MSVLEFWVLVLALLVVSMIGWRWSLAATMAVWYFAGPGRWLVIGWAAWGVV